MDKLLEVQKELPKIGKDANNPYFNSGYLTLEKLMDKVLPIFQRHELLLIQYPSFGGGAGGEIGSLITEIFDGDKKIFGCEMLLATKSQDPQAQGSAITYARRYALMAILGIVPAETDDDGNAASPAPIEKAMNQSQWIELGKLLEDKGIKS